MKPIHISIAAGALLATLATAQTTRYTVIDLGTLGGTFSSVWGINYTGRTAGVATLPNGNTHAFLEGFPGTKYDLGTLGGPNSFEGGLNASYQLAMYAETSKKDPFGNDFCGFGTNLICLPAVWNGAMAALPTLGGNNGQAYSINNQGQLAGVAETSTKDPTCNAPQVLQFQAALWGPNPGQVQELPPLPGDTVGFAFWLNNYGQVVGSSGTCANTSAAQISGPHAVLWQNGVPTNLGNLGGTLLALGAAINDLGEVTGPADLASDLPGYPFVQIHGWVWTKATGIQDLGTVGTDFSSLPIAINNNGQVVGESCDDMGNCRAFLSQNKTMTDLNALIPASSPLYLECAQAINDAGVIAGQGVQVSTGQIHAFLAIPIFAAAAAKFEPASPDLSRPMVLPEDVRKQLQQRLGFGRLGGQLNRPR